MAGGAQDALPASRVYVIDNDRLRGVVVEVDATETPSALAVLQAGLHELPQGQQLVYGYDVAVSGLGAWVGDRRVRITIWPALVDDAGRIEADDPDHPDADVLVIDVDPLEHGTELAALAELGRLFVAGPEAGPIPLVVDLDRDLVAEVVEQVSPRAGPPPP